MAQKQKPDMSSIFAKTDQAGSETREASGPTVTQGVGLKASEWAEIEDIADELGQTRHAIAAYALRYFLKQYQAGAIQPEQKPTLPEL